MSSPRARKWLKRVGITLGVIVLLPVVVLGLALIALQFPPVRLAARDQLLGLVSESIQGKLEVDDLRWPSIRHVELSGVRLWDREGKLVANVGMLSARIKLAPLFSGQIQLSEVNGDGLFLDLGTPGTDRGLLSVFESKTPEPEPPPDSGSALVVQIDRLCLEGSALEVQPTPDQGIGFHRFSTCAMFRMGENIDVRLDELRGYVALNGQYPVAFIDETALRAYDADPPQAISSPARAFLQGQISIADAAMGFDGRLELRGINRPTLEAAGVDGSILTAAADASIVVDGDSSKMNYTVEVRAPASRLRVQGDFAPNRSAQARIWSDGLELARFTTISTEKIVFAMGAKADLSRPEEPRMTAALESGSYGTWALPKVNVAAELAKDGTITVPRFEASYPAGDVRGRARIGAGGALYAALDAELKELAKIPPIAATLPGWNGRLAAKAEVRRAAESGVLNIDAQTTLERLRVDSPALAADRVTLKASAAGPADQLAVKANLSASELHFDDQRFAEVQLAAHGGPELYKLQGQVDGDRGRLDAWLKTSDAGLEAGGELQAKLPRGVATASVERVHLVSGRSLEISQLRAEHLGAKLTAEGSLGLGNEKSALKLQARVDNLSALTHEIAGADVPGKLFLTANLSGALDKPKVDLKLDYRDGPRLAGAHSQLSLRGELDAVKSRAEIIAKGVAGKATVDATLASRWKRGAPLSAAIDGRHELDVTVERLSIGALVRQSEAELPVPLAGTIAAKLHASGNLKGLDLKSEIGARVTVGEEPELNLQLTTNYGGGGLAFNAELIDPHGNLVTLNWHQATRLEQFVDKPLVLPDWLGHTDWEATIEVGSRRIADLPTVRTRLLMRELWPLRSELSVQLAHKAGAEPIGDVKMKTSWDPLGYDARRADCTQKVRPVIELVGKLREGLFVSELKGTSADKEMFSVKSQLGSTLEAWLEGKWLQITKAQVAAKMEEFDLAQWPLTCEQAAGTLSAAFSATDLFDKSAKFHAKVGGRRIVVGESLPFDFDMQAQALPTGMDLTMRLDRIGGHATIKGSVPISVYVHDPATSVDPNGPISFDLMLARVDAKSLLALVPVVARPSGAFDGKIKVYGTLSEPRGSGSIEMHDVSFTLPNLGQRISKVNGSIGIDDNKVVIPELELKDQGGTAKFRAELTMQSTKAFDVQLNAKFDDFPVRKQGVLIGRADAGAKVLLKATEAETNVDVKLGEVSVNLTGDTGADVQSLEPHQEIFVIGEPAPNQEEAEEHAEEAAQPSVIKVYVHADESLWVRRDDFAVRMLPDIRVRIAEGTSQITGGIRIERGYIALLGQQFDIKEGRVTFTGSQEVNPNLELTAESTSPSGKVVRVEVTGFVSAPKLAFLVDGQGVNAGEALIALTGRDSGSGSEESMEDQVASAAMGMTTGLLSLGARREFGDFIPMLSVDQTTDDTRVRAGFEADKLIPKFLRGFVQGAYVEGVVSTAGENPRADESGSGSAQAGVLLELMLPSDLVWAGQYGPGQTWSVDLNWRP